MIYIKAYLKAWAIFFVLYSCTYMLSQALILGEPIAIMALGSVSLMGFVGPIVQLVKKSKS